MAPEANLRVGNCYLEVLPGGTGVVAWVLPGVLPGVTWALPGLVFREVFFLWSQNIRVPQPQTFEEK